LESLGYIFLYFARGSLPWQGLKAKDDEKAALIKKMKESLSGRELCDGILPEEFATYIDYTRHLPFDDKPNYAYLRGLFRRRFSVEGFRHDNVFDWTKKMFDEVRGEASPAVSSAQEPQRPALELKRHRKHLRRRGRGSPNPRGRLKAKPREGQPERKG
jgi:casein kinase 1 delta/casein kinase I family protein HRR25